MNSEPADKSQPDREPPHHRAGRMAGSLSATLHRLGDLGAIERAKECDLLAVEVRSMIGELAATRKTALIEARDSGMTLTQIAAELGISVQAVSKAIKNDPGTGRPTIREDDG